MGTRKYSRNQCSLLIRVDGNEMEIPINFGMTPDEIRDMYPYLANLSNKKLTNPAIQFKEDAERGKFNHLSDSDYLTLVNKIRAQSSFWYQKPETTLLELGIRLAVDACFKGIPEIQDKFDMSMYFDKHSDMDIVTDEEADEILAKSGMELDTHSDKTVDAGDEKDVEMGIAGDMRVDIYGHGEDFLSKEFDDLTAEVPDRFSQIISGEAPDMDKYKSNYKPGGYDKVPVDDNGLLDIYSLSGSSDALFGNEPDDGSTSEELLGTTAVSEPEDNDPEDEEPINVADIFDVEPEFEDNDPFGEEE